MKKSVTLIGCALLVILFSFQSNAQQGNIWYFGEYAGVDFNSGSPTPISNGALNTNEGCATICDASGNLLFYTDGVKIWDSTHSVVSSALYGNSSSTQSAVVVPKPGSATNYFIFTMDDQYFMYTTHGLYYTEIQVSGGSVTVVSLNNLLLSHSDCTEKIAASCHANGTDYWITTLRQDGKFISWPITSTGVGVATASSVTAIPNPLGNNDDRVGYMKVNSQGNRLVVARRASNSQSELFDFDNSTGVVTFNYGVYHTGTVYGVEFSANGNYFYTSENFKDIVMYDITNISSPTTIYTRINSSKEYYLGALQMGPDGNIYVANGYENYDGNNLDMISSVENGSPVYHDGYVSLPAGHYCHLGLPDIVSCFVPVLNEPCAVDALFEVEYGGASCAINFLDASNVSAGSEIVAWQWTFGDGTSSSEQNPAHFYTAPGQYEVCLTVTAFDGEECCTSIFCKDVFIDEECNDPCEINHHFDWQIIDDCGECAVQFTGQVTHTNKPILAWLYDFGDGTTGTGQNPVHSYTSNGSYEVCVTAIGSSVSPEGQPECCVFTFCDIISIDCVRESGITNPDNPTKRTSATNTKADAQEQFKVYPNPSAGTITIELEIPRTQRVQVKIIDHAGKVCWKDRDIEVNQGLWQHALEVDLPHGIYFLIVEGETLTEVKKVRFLND